MSSCMQRGRSCNPFDSTPANINAVVSAEVERQFSRRLQGMIEAVAKTVLENMSKRDEAFDKRLSDHMLDVHSNLERNSVVLAKDQMERTSLRLQICEQKLQDLEANKNNTQNNTQVNLTVNSNESQLDQIDQRLSKFEEKALEMGGLQRSLGERIEKLDATIIDLESARNVPSTQKEHGDTEKGDIEERLTAMLLQYRSEMELKFQEQLDKRGVATSVSKSEVPETAKNEELDHASIKLKAGGVDLGDNALKKQDSLATLSAHSDVEYSFSPTIWDALFLIAFPGQTIVDMVAHAFITSLYFILIVAFLYAIATDFVSNPYSEFNLSRYEFWRATVGHDVRHVNAFDKSSLASRICSDDPALTLATHQQDVYSNIDTYLTIIPIGLGNFRVGPVICIACLSIWAMSLILNEIGAVQKLIVIWSIRSLLPSELLFRGEACELTRVQMWRVVMLTFTFLLRTAFNIVLFIYGGWWLVYTPDIPDLLLNTTALGFLLEIDATMFDLGAPYVLRSTIARMKPLKVREFPGMQFLPTANVLVTICIVLIFFVSVVQPNVDRMQQAAHILCGNDRDFVASISGPRGVNWVRTEKYDPDVPASSWEDGRVFAMRSLIMQTGDHQFYTHYQPTIAAVNSFLSETLRQYVVSKGSCVDKDVNNNIGAKLYVVSNNESMKLFPHCEKLRYLCLEFGTVGQAMRLMCPVTCGCIRSFKAGLVFLGYATEGCTLGRECSNAFALNAANEFRAKLDCNDTANAELSSMNWHVIVEVVSKAGSYLGTPAIALNASRELATFGCAGLLHLNESTRSTLCLSHSIPYACPSTCKCGFCATCIRALDCPNPCVGLAVGQLR